MRRSLRRSLLKVAGRIRAARRELEKAEEEVEALLSDAPAEPVSISAAEVSRRVADTVGAFLEGKPARRERGEEGVLESVATGALRDAVLAVATQSVARSIATRRRPSTTARVLAVLMEEPEREFDAASVARRSRCSEAVARTILHRLVAQGHARRSKDGSFRAADEQSSGHIRGGAP
jgi:hypothetical protein